jgi:hypothetical protein
VLTKPDLIGKNFKQFQMLFHNETMYLAPGWYVTKNPESTDVPWNESREQERVFFSAPPWSSEDSEYLDRIGTENLTNALSKLLNQRIAQWFVSIHESFLIDRVFPILKSIFASI